jgi:hypothetical protein
MSFATLFNHDRNSRGDGTTTPIEERKDVLVLKRLKYSTLLTPHNKFRHEVLKTPARGVLRLGLIRRDEDRERTECSP